MCRAALVDPPEQATTLAALANECLVTISLGLILFLIRFITASPEETANLSRDL
jgi:hypothetical protein